MKNIIYILFLTSIMACHPQSKTAPTTTKSLHGTNDIATYLTQKNKDYNEYEVATFAGGCFWCTEASFECLQGVKDVISGYSGGHLKHPTYEQVGRHNTGHAEAIQIYYNPDEISYDTLLEVLFVAHDPTQVNRQGNDVGAAYRSVIFYHNAQQKEAIHTFIRKQADLWTKPIATEILPYQEFWVAEDYHQDYYWLHPENSYVQAVSVPKVRKVEQKFKALLKEDCGK